MTSQPVIAPTKEPDAIGNARQQIERFMQERLNGRTPALVEFVDQLLGIASQIGTLRCKPAGNHGLHFELSKDQVLEVALDANRGKLRMMCARLAVLVQESGQEFQPYGGEGIIRKSCASPVSNSGTVAGNVSWKASWKNTTDVQEFTIQAQ